MFQALLHSLMLMNRCANFGIKNVVVLGFVALAEAREILWLIQALKANLLTFLANIFINPAS